jgi:hypothetical protein
MEDQKMPDPNAQVEFLLRVTGLEGSLKKHIEEYPQYAGVFDTDPSLPAHPIKKKDLPRLVLTQILPRLMKSFNYYKDDEELVWEAGLFNQSTMQKEPAPDDLEAASHILKKLLEELGDE